MADTGPAQLTITPAGWTLPIQPHQSLLEAALAGGVRLAKSCRNGTCRACLCPMTSGQVRYRVEWPGLSAEEREQGLVLPCVAEALGDVTLHAPSATQRL